MSTSISRGGVLLIILAVVITALTVGIPKAGADHSWGGYHWARTTATFTLKLGDNVNSTWDPYLIEARNDWNTSTLLDTVIVAGGTNAARGRNTPKNCQPTSGRVEVCNASYGSTGWLGIASIWVNGAHITQGTVKLNDTYFNSSTYNKPAWRRLVMCQEIAHDFGLDHQDESFNNLNLGTCMDYTNAPSGGIVGNFNYGPSNEHPNAHDFEELLIIYGHLDSSTTLSQFTQGASAQEEDSNDPKNWGQEVRRSKDGRTSVFEKDLGRGNKVVRHVFWAEPRGKSRE